jgi:tRNA threonylcarbamoyladenosine biosynthesis protein TsaE
VSDLIELISTSPEQTRAVGQALGDVLRGGDFVALCGPLGAGKTQLVKGIAAGLGVPGDEQVVSPTFVLVREYAGRLRLYHIDAYRLSGAAELPGLGLEEMACERAATVALEWADRVPEAVPPDACRVDLDHVAPDTRRIRIRWPAPDRLAALAAKLPA